MRSEVREAGPGREVGDEAPAEDGSFGPARPGQRSCICVALVFRPWLVKDPKESLFSYCRTTRVLHAAHSLLRMRGWCRR